ncbi:hypothetical protein AYL99_00679 [Fonsecaea erecta]|uniref:TauD/TfdA-like domain-containing protein n=1 Tax=Fonsecaea erecta TaxID=1367422 RepID=A0A178ZY98_9EURO|nr:hypothetical protein AYL99_00679 [Fonsecaea erecta]OAP64707.1 hypothetical protein AYL99_00679 [Fonsecaea erecta]
MPGLIAQPESDFYNITVKKLHPTFAAQISGVDFSQPLSEETFIYPVQYGVVVFRGTNLTDEAHLDFTRRFRELDDVKPYISAGRKNRLRYDEQFERQQRRCRWHHPRFREPMRPSRQGPWKTLPRWSNSFQLITFFNNFRLTPTQGNDLFQVNSSFNPRRAGYSLLLMHELPPPGDVKETLARNNYVAAHSTHHSRKLAAPEFFKDLDPLDYPMGRPYLVQRHESSGRMNLDIASHVHHLEREGREGLLPADEAESARALFDRLYADATQLQYTVEIEWQHPADLVVWDNTCTMHRAVGGPFLRKYRRDSSAQAWSLNEHTDVRVGLP